VNRSSLLPVINRTQRRVIRHNVAMASALTRTT